MAVRYTRELLDEAARETTSFDDAVRWCGGNPTPGSRRYIRALRELVARSRSVAEVVRRLGINAVSGNQVQIGRRTAALGIDTLHVTPAHRRHLWGIRV